MVQILAHRGLWDNIQEKNTIEALKNALEQGFGIETDIRDDRGKLVISHDPVININSTEFGKLIEIIVENTHDVPIAINIKADGLSDMLSKERCQYEVNNIFFFDMSIPEQVQYKKNLLPFFTRRSDIEDSEVLYHVAKGIWIDSFGEYDWIDEELITGYLQDDKDVCVISPEIHGCNYLKIWDLLRRIDRTKIGRVMLCTDKPKEAREYFA